MRLHANAKTTPQSRALLIRRIQQEGWGVPEVAEAFGISPRTVYKWLRRYRDSGAQGLVDRSCVPHRIPHRTSAARVRRILELRTKRRTGWQIAQRLRMPPATVHAVLRREGLGRLAALEPKPAVRRYEREHPGELLHLDIKTLGRIGCVGKRIHGDRSIRARGVGWEYVHVAIDDASRLAYVEVLPDQGGVATAAFLERARRWYAKHRIAVQRVLTDNGSGYCSLRFAAVCQSHKIRHLRTRAYRPQTNGKAERFIGTLLRSWAYARAYRTSNQRTKALPKWLRYYNQQRPHRSLGMQTPWQRARRAA